MGSLRKQGGVWRDVQKRCRKVDGRWRFVKERYTKVNGSWRLVSNYFHVEPYLVGDDNFIGTYKIGLLDDGKLGVEISGQQGTLSKNVQIGFRIRSIPNLTPVSFVVTYQNGTAGAMMFSVRNGVGERLTYSYGSVSDYTMSWSAWNGSELILTIDFVNDGLDTSKFTIENLNINGANYWP